MTKITARVAIAWLAFTGAAAAQSDSLPSLLTTLRSVEREAKGNRAATQAWEQLTAKANGYQLPTILAAIDDSGPLAANWLRGAVDTIAQRELERTGALPVDGLEQFLAQKQHDPRARRLAFEWIVRVEPKARDRLVPGFLDDPSLELRRDAVAQLISAAETAETAKKNDDAVATSLTIMASFWIGN
jgi:hypothetical protein